MEHLGSQVERRGDLNRRHGGDGSRLIEASELDLGTGMGIFEEHVFWSEVCVYNFAKAAISLVSYLIRRN